MGHYAYISNMPPKPTTMSKKDKGDSNVSKMVPRKVAKKANNSAVTQQDLDSSQEAMDNQAVMDSGLDMASRMDMMMMNMFLQLTWITVCNMDSFMTTWICTWT